MIAPLSAFTGDSIYFDTMLPYALLRGIAPEAQSFFERVERGDFVAYTSALTFDELAYRLVLALTKDRYSGSPLEQLRDDEHKIMTEFAPVVVTHLHRLQEFPHLVVLDVLATDLDVMGDAMVRYQLRPRDGLHLAAMRRTGCLALASNDQHFDRVPSLQRFVF